MPAALEGAVEKLQGAGYRVWAANLYLHAQTAPDPKPMAQTACNDFNKKMYRHGPGVSTGFCGLHYVWASLLMPTTFNDHCKSCPYNPASGHSESPNHRPTAPLNMEANSPLTLLIFQAPGADEWAARQPICSSNPNSAAARIRNSLLRIDKSRSDFSITNSTQCYPGKGNSIRDKAPLASARKCCVNWLKQDIEAFAFSQIIVFGAKAKSSVTELGYANDPRFQFLRHPSGSLSNAVLDDALRSAV